MPTTVIAYYTNRSTANLVGLLDLSASATTPSRMNEVAGLLGSPCELLIDEPGYTVYCQQNAAEREPINPVLTMPNGQAVHGNVLIINVATP